MNPPILVTDAWIGWSVTLVNLSDVSQVGKGRHDFGAHTLLLYFKGVSEPRHVVFDSEESRDKAFELVHSSLGLAPLEPEG